MAVHAGGGGAAGLASARSRPVGRSVALSGATALQLMPPVVRGSPAPSWAGLSLYSRIPLADPSKGAGDGIQTRRGTSGRGRVKQARCPRWRRKPQPNRHTVVSRLMRGLSVRRSIPIGVLRRGVSDDAQHSSCASVHRWVEVTAMIGLDAGVERTNSGFLFFFFFLASDPPGCRLFRCRVGALMPSFIRRCSPPCSGRRGRETGAAGVVHGHPRSIVYSRRQHLRLEQEGVEKDADEEPRRR